MITVNGRPGAVPPVLLADLLSKEGVTVDSKGIAVAVNEAVVPRRQWAELSLTTGDRVEIVKVLQGG